MDRVMAACCLSGRSYHDIHDDDDEEYKELSAKPPSPPSCQTVIRKEVSRAPAPKDLRTLIPSPASTPPPTLKQRKVKIYSSPSLKMATEKGGFPLGTLHGLTAEESFRDRERVKRDLENIKQIKQVYKERDLFQKMTVLSPHAIKK
jgi:hypothetical protein